jgi:hypothetical protein
MRKPRVDKDSVPGDGLIRHAPGMKFTLREDTPISPTIGELHKWMNDIRGAVLSASFGIENELVLLALADEFGTNDHGSVGIEYFEREQGWREEHSLGRKIDRVKSIIRKCRTKEAADEIIQKLVEYRDLRNLLAHYPCWLEPVNRDGVTKIEEEGTISLILFIADRQHVWEIDREQAATWRELIRFVRISVENLRREKLGAPILNDDGSLPPPETAQHIERGVEFQAEIEHGNVSQIIFPKV